MIVPFIRYFPSAVNETTVTQPPYSCRRTAVAFPDAIALGGYPIDIHAPTNAQTITRHLGHQDIYQIPLGSLLPETIENLVVVGRCISATHEAAAAIRVTPIAMAIGQAGGVTAGEACRLGLAPWRVPHQTVQATLRAQGAQLPAAAGV